MEAVREVIEVLGQSTNIDLLEQSSLYITAPQDFTHQADFINAVVKLETSLEPLGLLDELQALEIDFGRDRKKPRYGPRTIDLDILLIDEQMINTSRLVVPHEKMHQRAFVLAPLMEIDSTLQIPGHGALAPLLEQCSDQRVSKI
jgi:2-amino-4-hydroxy-6-hydroxymethyldihydropteridine diphosphokinase